MMICLAADHGGRKTVMIDATYLKAFRTAMSMGVKKGKLGRPLDLFATAGQVIDYIGTQALPRGVRRVDWLL